MVRAPRVAGSTLGGSQIEAQTAHRRADSRPHLVGQAPHGVGNLELESAQVIRASVELGTTGFGDLVNGFAAIHRLGDEPIFLELGQARIDRAGARNVGAAETVTERLN